MHQHFAIASTHKDHQRKKGWRDIIFNARYIISGHRSLDMVWDPQGGLSYHNYECHFFYTKQPDYFLQSLLQKIGRSFSGPPFVNVKTHALTILSQLYE